MSAPISVPSGQHGVVRVFALSMTDADAKTLSADPAGRAALLGANGPIDPEHVVMFPVRDLEEIGLSGYLIEGAGVSEAHLTEDKAKLDKLGGWVVIVYAQAFGGQATELTPASSLTLIGTYGTQRTDWSEGAQLVASSAAPYSAQVTGAKKRPSDAAMSGRIAMLVLIGLGLFTYAFIRMAG